MSKRNKRQQRTADVVTSAPVVTIPTEFGFEEMLSELEAIVTEAQSRQTDEAEAA
ncbi:hypothetical protein ACM26M_13825 [Kluyvera cryocrescens]|uniref:hypothetical protein n=1 Tax=Kluyvera TaxID=579 RepID=UPI0032DE4849